MPAAKTTWFSLFIFFVSQSSATMTLPSGRRDLIEYIFLSIEILLLVCGFIFLAFYIFPGEGPIDSGSRTKFGVPQDSASQTAFSRFPNTSSSLASNVSITLQPFEYTMTIDHFGNLISKVYQPGIPTIQSPSFPVGKPFSFYLSILPNGDEEAGFLAIFVTQNKEGHWNTSDQLYFCISLLDAHGEKRFTESESSQLNNLTVFYLKQSVFLVKLLGTLLSQQILTGVGPSSSVMKSCSIPSMSYFPMTR